ncbi:MAG: hypothetical protein V2I57_03780 [Xanthomonadales bacterium]|nr:hypothetical protein [Xanthomonadales bacterium]
MMLAVAGLRAWRGGLLLLAFALQLPASAPAAAVELDLQAVEALPPSEQHRQLSLMLLVSAGVDDVLLDQVAKHLEPDAGETPGTAGDSGGSAAPRFDTDRYTSPLARIVDQASLLAGAEQLFRFTLAHRPEIRARLDALESGDTDLASPGAIADLTEDTILIRQAIADSLRATKPVTGDETSEAAEQRYRAQTVVLRNSLEYTQFKAELDVLTGQAIASVGGRLDAYQRMFDVETNTGVLDRRIRSAELIYLPEGQFDPRAGELTEEMLRNMVLSESQPNR